MELSLVDWSRLQFAMTAIYHWFFVPLTLGLAFILAFMESAYVRTGKQEWLEATKFWMKLFGINFAIGVATGIILEFEFGTNWSNYSRFVGDIFGAPLAIEGIFAFFMESTFIAIMFFGWDKVSKRVHLMSTWLTAFGASLSALWILVANGWMQNPVGMRFNPETVRNEMVDFWAVLFNPSAISKFTHTVSSSYLLAAVFVIGVSSWFLLRNRQLDLAKRSIKIASIFGVFMALVTIWTGDTSGKVVAQKQPMKLAAMESLYDGEEGASLSVLGLLRPSMQPSMPQDSAYYFNIQLPKMLSVLGFGNTTSYVAGINDLTYGNAERNLLSAETKMQLGRDAIDSLRLYLDAKRVGDSVSIVRLEQLFDPAYPQGKLFLEEKFAHFGYGYLERPEQVIPNVPLTYYSFRVMVALGMWFLLLFVIFIVLGKLGRLQRYRWLLWLSVLSIPLAYLASQAGWIVAEVGRQPWVIQNLMPNSVAVSRLDQTSVQVTFFLLVALFTTLAIVEVRIMLKQIRLKATESEKELNS